MLSMSFLVNIFRTSAAMSFVDYLCLVILWFCMLVMTDFWDDFALTCLISGAETKIEVKNLIISFWDSNLINFFRLCLCLKFWILFWFSPLILFVFLALLYWASLDIFASLPIWMSFIFGNFGVFAIDSHFFENLV